MRAPSATSEPARNPPAKQAVPAEQKTVTIIDGSSGARHDVAIGGDGRDKAEAAMRRPPMMAGIDPRLLEKSRYGMIPVVVGWTETFHRLCRRSRPRQGREMPVVAIVVGGLGVGAAKTADAIMKLPPAVTLAFTPYGSDPAKLAERARAQRHEILLQIPMEPFDYPDNDPGPQTLLTTLAAEQNLDRLYWHLSRFQGYAGIANFMGARFVVADAVMQPIIREAAKRGLGYLDDGSSPRSVAPVAGGGPGRCRSPRPTSASMRCRPLRKSTGRWPSLRAWPRSAASPSASLRRCRFRSSGSASGSRRSKATASCLCH